MKETLPQALQRIEQLQHKVDSLKTVQSQAILRLEKIQLQVDSLKTVSHKFNPDLLEDRLAQASETVNYLGTMATGWGTVYSAISLIVVAITIALPIWITKRAKKSIRKLNIKFDTKTAEISTAYTSELAKINESFNKKYKELSFRNSKLLEGVRQNAQELTDVLQREYTSSISRLESNLWVVNASFLLETKQYSHAAGWYMVAACMGDDPWNNYSNVTLHNLQSFLNCLTQTTPTQLDDIQNTITQFGLRVPLDEYLNRLENFVDIHGENIFKDKVSEIRAELKNKTE